MTVDAVRPVADGYRVLLTDGTRLNLDIGTRSRYGIEPGVSLDTTNLEALRGVSALREAESAALRILAGADHTALGLSRKLQQKGHDVVVARQVVARLQETGYVDDERAARAWVERRLGGRPLGRAALLAGLERHGVPRELAERVVGAAVSPSTEAAAAARLLGRMYPTAESRRALTDRVERARALRRLASRGIGGAAARRALEGMLHGDVDAEDGP